MDETNFVMDEKSIVAYNLAQYRKAAKLTQQELADKLNYTDKAVSKWERGEAVPDIFVLKQIADIYNITVNDFLIEHENHEVAQKRSFPKKHIKHLLIALLSIALVWLVATVVVVFSLIWRQDGTIIKYVYIWAVPVSMIIAVVFSMLWGKLYLTAIMVSALEWSFCVALHVTLNMPNLWAIYLVGAAMQLLIIMWFILQGVRRKMHRENETKAKKEEQ